jgi:hypothetical protein
MIAAVSTRKALGKREPGLPASHARPLPHGVYVPQEFDAHRFAEWVRAGLGAR